MKEIDPTPNPGSPEAVASGCLCPVLDNGRGAGFASADDGSVMFWQNADCPLHGNAMVARMLEAVGGKGKA